MPTNLHLGQSESGRFNIPVNAASQTFAIIARRGQGKSYTASVMAEGFINAEVPIVVLDPTGAWWGLRSSADGKSAGYPVIIIGGSHADVPLDEHAGKIIADLVIDHPGYYILDMSLMESNAAQDRFAADFACHFYRRKASNKFPVHLFIDEADSFIPQNPQPGQRRMLGAYDTIIRRGRIHGIGATLISQRPAVLNKNALSQAETLIALQISSPHDQKALDAWVKANGTDAQREIMMGSLASLQRGEAWIWSPSWLGCFERVNIRKRLTFNSSATPEIGSKPVVAPKLAQVDLAALSERVRASAEAIKANDPAALKRQVAELKAENQRLLTAAPKVEVKTREVPVLDAKTIAALKKLADTLEKSVSGMRDLSPLISKALGHLQTHSAPVYNAAKKPVAGIPITGQNVSKLTSIVAVDAVTRTTEPRTDTQGAPKIKAGARRMMIALAQRPGLTKRQLCVRSGLVSSGTFSSYISMLRTSGFMVGDTAHGLSLTPAGLAELGAYDPLPTGQRLRDYWLGELKAGAARMLNVLVKHYPAAIPAAQLSEESGIAISGTFSSYMSRLRTLELMIGERGALRASDELFD